MMEKGKMSYFRGIVIVRIGHVSLCFVCIGIENIIIRNDGHYTRTDKAVTPPRQSIMAGPGSTTETGADDHSRGPDP